MLSPSASLSFEHNVDIAASRLSASCRLSSETTFTDTIGNPTVQIHSSTVTAEAAT